MLHKIHRRFIMPSKMRATNMINYCLKLKFPQKYVMNFLFNYKLGNCFAKVLGLLIITEYFQVNDHVFFNIHHSSVQSCLGSYGMTMNTLIGLIHYVSILIHCQAFHFDTASTSLGLSVVKCLA